MLYIKCLLGERGIHVGISNRFMNLKITLRKLLLLVGYTILTL